jgi:hypothetical protein
MTLPASGQISFSQINTELGRASNAQISLNTAEDGGYATINNCAQPKPNATNPAAISEWYSYNHSAPCFSECSATFSFSGGNAYPRTYDVPLGTLTGTVRLDYFMQSIPDRAIVRWNGNVVIDTGYRGSNSYNALALGGSSGDRLSFTSSLVGKVDPILGVTYPNTTNFPNDGYPLILGLGTDNASFDKTTSSSTAFVDIYGPDASTAWSARLNCPVPFVTVNQAYLQGCDGGTNNCGDIGPIINVQGTKIVSGYFYRDGPAGSPIYRIITTGFQGTADVVFTGQELVCTSSPCNLCCL